MSIAAFHKEASRILADVNRVASQFATLTADGSGEPYQVALESAFGRPLPGRQTLLNAAIASTSDADVRNRIETAQGWIDELFHAAHGGPSDEFRKASVSLRDALRKLEPFAVRTSDEIAAMVASWSERWRWSMLFQDVAASRKHRDTASQLRADAKTSDDADYLKHLAKAEDINAETFRSVAVSQTDELDEIANWVRTQRPEALEFVPCVSVWQGELSDSRYQQLAEAMRKLEGRLRVVDGTPKPSAPNPTEETSEPDKQGEITDQIGQENLAIAMLFDKAITSENQLSQKMGVPRPTLRGWKRYVEAKLVARPEWVREKGSGQRRAIKGSKSKDGVVEAWVDEDA